MYEIGLYDDGAWLTIKYPLHIPGAIMATSETIFMQRLEEPFMHAGQTLWSHCPPLDKVCFCCLSVIELNLAEKFPKESSYRRNHGRVIVPRTIPQSYKGQQPCLDYTVILFAEIII